MPGDETYVRLVDALAEGGPAWLFAGGMLAVLACLLGYLAVKYMPVVRDLKLGQLEVDRRREERERAEADRRAERDRETAAIMARQVDAQNRSTEAMHAITAAVNAANAKLEVSQQRSLGMGGKVDEIHGDVAEVKAKVDDIHAVVVKSK